MGWFQALRWGLFLGLAALLATEVRALRTPVAPARTPIPAIGEFVPTPPQDDRVLESYLDPRRDLWQKPDQVVGALGLRPGDTVLDVGAGSGYFAWRLSSAVGASGRVVALDVDPGALAFLEERLERQPPPFPNVFLMQSAMHDVGLEPAVADLAFLCDAHFYVEGGPTSVACLRSLGRALKPGGRLAVLEGISNRRRGDVSREQLARDFLAAGFRLERWFDFLERQHFGLFEAPPGAFR